MITAKSTLALCFGVITLAALPATAEESAVTYNKDIAPLIHKHCLECHRPDMGAPFEFTTYDDVRKRARLITEVIQSGFMPPWKAERGHTPLLNERGLDAHEITLFKTWEENGRPEGNPADLPTAPTFPEGWRLGVPDLVVEMEEPFPVPADGPDIYHNFVLSIPDLPENTWVKGVEFRPGATSVVHHSLFDLDTTGVARRMDAYEAGPGFGGMEQRFSDRRIGGYAVGALPALYPDGVALEIPNGADLVMETHFHPSGKAESEKSSIGIYYTNEAPTRELIGVPIPALFGLTTGLDIPAGEANYVLEHTFTVPYDMEAIKISPHAHYICKEITSTATFPDGREQVLIAVKDWDFAWQEQYQFQDPVLLPQGTVIKLTFVYDNSADNPRNPFNPPQRIAWGPQSTDEMAGCGMAVIPLRPEDGDPIRQALADYRLAEFEQVDVAVLRTVVQAEILDRFDKDHDGEIGWGERLAMAQFWRATQAGAPSTAATEMQELIVRRVFEDYFETRRRWFQGGTLGAAALLLGLLTLLYRRWRRRRTAVH